jgi:hypothetical protein
MTACNSVDKSMVTESTRTVSIDFANASIELPKSFELTTTDDLKFALINSNKSDKIIQTNLQKIEAIENFPFAIIIYSDTSNFENNIWFQQGEHFQLTKELSKHYINLVEKQLKLDWSYQGIDYERVEGKYLSNKNAQIIKLKYKLTLEGETRFTTQYLISTRTQTIGVIINNMTTIDFENLIKGIRVK